MPEFDEKELKPYASVIVRFASQEAMEEFGKLINQPLKQTTKSLWHPKLERGTGAHFTTKRAYVDES